MATVRVLPRADALLATEEELKPFTLLNDLALVVLDGGLGVDRLAE